jgi:hypothetical protein
MAAFKEIERKRIEKTYSKALRAKTARDKVEREKTGGEISVGEKTLIAKDSEKAYDPAWFCPTYLAFLELGYPAGKAKCLPLFKINSGSGPRKGKIINNPSAEEITSTILKTGGRTSRRAVQSHIAAATNASATISERESEREGTILIMRNFNGLNQWNAQAHSLRGLVDLSESLGDSAEEIRSAKIKLRDHLSNPYVPLTSTPQQSKSNGSITNKNYARDRIITQDAKITSNSL